MGWSGRAPAHPPANLARGAKDKEHAMSEKPNSVIAVIGIDIGKNSFHVVGLDARGAMPPSRSWISAG
jgi:transposase